MTTVVPARLADVCERIAELAAEVLRVPLEKVSLDVSPELLGLDSVTTLELIAAVEDEFGIRVPHTAISSALTVRQLATIVQRRHADLPDEVESPARVAALARMLADARLPRDVVPAKARRPPRGQRVLLTGATGFVGAFVMRELLRQPDLEVVCLVRPGQEQAPLERVRRNLRTYDLWSEACSDRIRCVEGDLAAARIGLDADAHRALAVSIDAVYHLGGAVDWVQPYEQLRRTNVLGTLELLRLACRNGTPLCFASSMAVCYDTNAQADVDERHDPLTQLDGLHLGYAQTKCVAEALVREAGARGLPVTILRPGLIGGDSHTGISNADDLVTLFLRGCIRMGAAPDLDWTMDLVPVDHVARAIVALATTATAPPCDVTNVTSPSARSWREVVLAARLRGHSLELLPYAAWADELRRTGTSRDHPLFALKPFLLRSVPVAGRPYAMPQLYEESRRRRVRTTASTARLTALGVQCPPMNLDLLDRYLSSCERRGIMPGRPSRGATHGESLERGIASRMTPVLRERLGDTDLRVTRVDIAPASARGDASIIAELTSWSHGVRDPRPGLWRVGISYESTRQRGAMNVVVKVKPVDADVIEVGGHVACLCGRELGEAYALWRDHVGLTHSHTREPAVYRLTLPGLATHRPELLASWTDAGSGRVVLVIEHVAHPVVADAYDRPWTDREIEIALHGLAHLHAAAWDNRDVAAAPWLPPLRSANGMARMIALWEAASRHARPYFLAWQGERLAAAQGALSRGIESWWAPMERYQRTLIHNDFNSRNVMLRGFPARLCAYDWELATIGAPQRDLAEFLCFVLTPEDAAHARRWVDRYRQLLERRTHASIGVGDWDLGFRAALCDVGLDRLPMYVMAHRLRAQSFLPRVAATWLALHEALPPR